MRCSILLLLGALATPLAASAQEAAPTAIDTPLAIAQSVKEIRVPHHNAEGKIRLRLNAARAERASTTEFTFGDLRIEIFDENPEQATLEVLMPEAVFDQTTRRLVSDRRAVIKGETIEITGRELEFNIDSRTSRLRGPVTMVISGTEKLTP